jgi:hypothetical protein
MFAPPSATLRRRAARLPVAWLSKGPLSTFLPADPAQRRDRTFSRTATMAALLILAESPRANAAVPGQLMLMCPNLNAGQQPENP